MRVRSNTPPVGMEPQRGLEDNDSRADHCRRARHRRWWCSGLPELYDSVPNPNKPWIKVECAGHYMPWQSQRTVLHHVSKQWLKHGTGSAGPAGNVRIGRQASYSWLTSISTSPSSSKVSVMRFGRQHTVQSSVNVWRRPPLSSGKTSFSSPQNAQAYCTTVARRDRVGGDACGSRRARDRSS